MEEILKKAHELGELIAKSEELLTYQEMEAAFASDEEAQKAVATYEEKKPRFVRGNASGRYDT